MSERMGMREESGQTGIMVLFNLGTGLTPERSSAAAQTRQASGVGPARAPAAPASLAGTGDGMAADLRDWWGGP